MSFAPNTANFIHEFQYNSCSRPFWVYAATGIPAFLELWLTLSILDLEDLARMKGFNISNKALAPSRRGPRRGGLVLPRGVRLPSERYAALGLRTLLIVTIPLEIIGFTMLAYYATDRFFYRWTSLLENIKCKGEAFTLMRNNSDFGVFPNSVGGAIALTEVLSTAPIYSDGSFSTGVPLGVYNVYLALEIDGVAPSNPSDYEIGVLTTGALGVSDRFSGVQELGRGKPGTLVFSGKFYFPLFGGGTIGWVIKGPAVPVGLTVKSGLLVIDQEGEDL